jgi:hypothetical protein
MVLMSNCFSGKKMIPTQVHTWPFVRLHSHAREFASAPQKCLTKKRSHQRNVQSECLVSKDFSRWISSSVCYNAQVHEPESLKEQI